MRLASARVSWLICFTLMAPCLSRVWMWVCRAAGSDADREAPRPGIGPPCSGAARDGAAEHLLRAAQAPALRRLHRGHGGERAEIVIGGAALCANRRSIGHPLPPGGGDEAPGIGLPSEQVP